ncbi:hypothetical protein AVEN_35670-1 [Araneus ventricosus]|uniref:Secreted protein n=1 Tax=Araneus ventricosus TaxID=182803 RepID=A0A4Y2GFH9_ARAVE|nr:hypothetical protein AVEN_35670-1 [Araneus ventricosus]
MFPSSLVFVLILHPQSTETTKMSSVPTRMKAPDLYPSTVRHNPCGDVCRRRLRRSNPNMPRRVLNLMVHRFLVYRGLKAGQPSDVLFSAFHAPITPMFHRRKWAVENNSTPRNYAR